MKVLLCHNYYQIPTGEFQVFNKLKHALERNNIEVRTYTRHNDEINDMGGLGRLAAFAQTAYSNRTGRELKRLFNAWRPDVVEVLNVMPLITPSVYLACRQAGIPVVQNIQNYRWFCVSGHFFRDGGICGDCMTKTLGRLHGIRHRCYRGSLGESLAATMMTGIHSRTKTYTRCIDRTIVPTKFAKDQYIRYGIPAEQVTIRPNYVELPPTISDQDDGFFFFAGRMDQMKNPEVILRAAAIRASSRFKLAGDGPLLNKLKSFAKDKGLENVEFLGRVSNVKCMEHMQRCRAVLFTSKWFEGMPITILEAFARAKPVIACDIGAMGEIIRNGQNGLFFHPGDGRKLAECISALNDNPDQARNMGHEARRDAESLYSEQAYIDSTLSIYKELIRA